MKKLFLIVGFPYPEIFLWNVGAYQGWRRVYPHYIAPNFLIWVKGEVNLVNRPPLSSNLQWFH